MADPPPTYESIFGEIRQAREESSGTVDFLKKVAILFVSTIGCTICLAIFLAIPIACIVIGVKYEDDCPVEKYIPIYLIVLGAFGVLRNIVGLYTQVKKRSEESDSDDDDSKKSLCERTIDCFLIGWFIAGNVWIYSVYEPSYDPTNHHHYCDQTLYLFAFWLTTASYIFIGFVCCCMCCVAFCSILME